MYRTNNRGMGMLAKIVMAITLLAFIPLMGCEQGVPEATVRAALHERDEITLQILKRIVALEEKNKIKPVKK